MSVAVERGYLDSKAAAKYLGISVFTLRDWRRRKLVSFYKPGGNCLYTMSDLDAAMAAHRIQARAEVEIADWERKVAKA